MTRFLRDAAICVLLLANLPQARALPVFSETFDSGSATFTTGNDAFWKNAGIDNGLIVKDLSGVPAFLNEITSDVSGSGYFLFEGTNGGGTANGEFYISPTFSVAANTDYIVSFYATEANGYLPPSLEPIIGGAALTPAVTPAGYFNDGITGHQWQQFTFAWNSASNTSTSLALNDLNLGTDGNDFAVDDIAVNPATTSAPLPGSLALGFAGALAVLCINRRRPQAV
jgi:hypothetical protein